MATTTRSKPSVPVTDASAEGPAVLSGDGGSIDELIDAESLRQTPEAVASQKNRAGGRGFRAYQKKVIQRAGVTNTHKTRQLASNVCGSVARLQVVPDDEETIQDDRGKDTTEFEQQIVASARWAELQMGDEGVIYTVTARKLARAALDFRAEDPDGSKGVAWVNDLLEDEAGVLDD